jgi:predicted nucleic acid-binding protein
LATTPSPQSSPRRCALSEPRVVLDTQILLRGALARTQSLTARIYDAWRDRRFILLVSDSILTEVEMVTARPEVLRKLRVTSREITDGLKRVQAVKG